MPTDELLSKEEMEALMEVVSQRKLSAVGNSAGMVDVQPYELVSQENAVNGILPVLKSIHERFSHRMRIGLFEMLRRDLEVQADPIAMRDYNDVITSLIAPCSLNVVGVSPLSGPGLIIFERQLVFLVVDAFFGGSGRMYNGPDVRDFTITEVRFIQRLLKLTLQCMEAAWQPFAAIKCACLGSEHNPQFVTAINPLEKLVVASLQIQREDNASSLHVALPCSMFEPVRSVLQASLYKEHPTHSERLTQLLRDGVKDSQVDVHCLLAEIDLTINELLLLKAGDVISVEIPGTAVLLAEGIPVYSGSYGVAQGLRAVKIEKTLTKPGDSSIHPYNEDLKP